MYSEVQTGRIHMRTILLAAASFGLLTGAALADGVQTSAASVQPAVATSVADAQHYAAPDDKIVCLHRLHEGMLTNEVDCKNERGWEKTRRDAQFQLELIQLGSLQQGGHR